MSPLARGLLVGFGALGALLWIHGARAHPYLWPFAIAAIIGVLILVRYAPGGGR